MKKLILTLFIACLSLQAQYSRRAPGFALPDFTGKWHDLADYRGKVVLLDMIQTTCPHCIELSGLLNQVQAKFGDKVQVLSVVTMPDTVQKVQAYAVQYKVGTPILLDQGQMIASYLQITPKNPTVKFPQLFIIDRNGLIRRQLAEEAATSLSSITAAVEAALK